MLTGLKTSGLTHQDIGQMQMYVNYEVETLIVKDMSRLGREYLQAGQLTELYLPAKGIRFIAINDGVDSLIESSADFNPIRNWTNELHAKESSKKVFPFLYLLLY